MVDEFNASTVSNGRVELIGFDGRGAKLLLKVHDGDCPFVIGREQLNEATVSRTHAQIISIEESFYIEDLLSSNGTVLNGKALYQRREIKNGDVLRLANIELDCVIISEENK